jgi:hypothetical protein
MFKLLHILYIIIFTPVYFLSYIFGNDLPTYKDFLKGEL